LAPADADVEDGVVVLDFDELEVLDDFSVVDDVDVFVNEVEVVLELLLDGRGLLHSSML
jgi:hypothetical protein